MPSLNSIKRQLKSVRSTQKITNAMSLVSTAKLQKQKQRYIVNNVFAEEYHKMLLSAFSGLTIDLSQEKYFNPAPVNNPLHIVITSNSGLCGSYNMELLKYMASTIDKNDPIFAIGTFGIKWLDANGYMVVKRFDRLDDADPEQLNRLIDNILVLYRAGEVSKVDIIYTQYINTLNFSPSTYELLPLEMPDELEHKDIEYGLPEHEMLDVLVPKYISAIIYSTFLEAKTSEHAARRGAMDNANSNAQSLIEEISLQLNQARQATITQEVNEIISGAEAL